MAFSVTTRRISLGNKVGVINEVTGDASTDHWETGLSRVLFYIGHTQADADLLVDGWYLNYSDAGSTAANGTVHFTTAPDSGEVWYCFGVGDP